MTEPRSIYPKHFLSEPVPRANTGFILMPFADEFEPVHEAIRAAIESAGLEPLRADDIFSTRAGMEKILRGIAEAEVIAADMSGQNANVFYEVGVAHTQRENVILLMREDDDFPFDLQHIDHLVYRPTQDGLRELTERLASVIRSLPTEPAAEPTPAQQGTSEPMTPSNMRRELRHLLQNCERQWVREIVPTQNEGFLERFWERIKSSREAAEQKSILAESIEALQPAFLRPWQPIEVLGFDAVEEEGQFEAVAPQLFEALERAYALSTRDEVRQAHSTVVGHGQLLALRTWTLWGAYALSSANWDAVEVLLHQQASFITPSLTKPYRASFAENKHFHYPDAAGHSPGLGFGDLAAQSIYNQTEAFAEQRFFDLEEMQAYIGLWLLASEIAYVTGEGHLFWSIAPQSQLQRIIDRLEADSTYARNFTQAVFRTDPKEVNQTWQTAIVDPLLQNPRMRFFVGDLLPSRFAE